MHCRPRVAGKIRAIPTYRRPRLPLIYHQRSPMSAFLRISNIGCGSRSLTHLSARLTVRADDGHATPLSLSGKPFRLTFILLSIPVRFPALDPIEPQPPPRVCSPANSFKFQPCGRLGENKLLHLIFYSPGGPFNTFAPALQTLLRFVTPNGHRLRLGLTGYLIPVAPLGFVPHRRTCSR